MQKETTPDPGDLIGLATSESLVTDDRMYCYLLANILYWLLLLYEYLFY